MFVFLPNLLLALQYNPSFSTSGGRVEEECEGLLASGSPSSGESLFVSRKEPFDEVLYDFRLPISILGMINLGGVLENKLFEGEGVVFWSGDRLNNFLVFGSFWGVRDRSRISRSAQ
jgi:hypothetical protein